MKNLGRLDFLYYKNYYKHIFFEKVIVPYF